MPAVLYLLIALGLGYFLRRDLVDEKRFAFLYRTDLGFQLPLPFLTLPLDLLVGLTVSATFIFLISMLKYQLTGSGRWFPWGLWLGLIPIFVYLAWHIGMLLSDGLSYKRKSITAETRLGWAVTLLTLIWAWFLSFKTFFLNDGVIEAGFTVFSDLAPHSALVRNFGVGGNIPPSYPHFAQAGMFYRFFFYYLAGILNALGLPLDWAINLPSMLGTLAFVNTLGFIAMAFTRKRSAWPLTFLLFMGRSSLGGFYLLQEEMKKGNSFFLALRHLREAGRYAGPLPYDEWGLYNLNVFANQRHFLWGMALLLLILGIFYPSLAQAGSLREFFRADAWQVKDEKLLIYLGFLGFPLSYWHGSVAIALLLILAVWGLFAKEKLSYCFFAVITVGGAFFWRALLGGPPPKAGAGWQWGYLLTDKSPAGLVKFLGILLGPALIFLVVRPWLEKNRALKIAGFSIWMPIVFAFTVSLTPDVMVNHKYFLMTQMLGLPFIGDSLLKIAGNKPDASRPGPSRSLWFRSCLAVLLFISLTFTGLTDIFAYVNQSNFRVQIQTQDEFSRWIYQNTEANSTQLTPPWHMHSYFLTGRQTYYGHAYYAGSAGYDTAVRLAQVQRFVTGDPEAIEEMRKISETYHIRYFMVDNSWRQNPDYRLNEGLLAEKFPLAASFPSQDGLKIYDLQAGYQKNSRR